MVPSHKKYQKLPKELFEQKKCFFFLKMFCDILNNIAFHAEEEYAVCFYTTNIYWDNHQNVPTKVGISACKLVLQIPLAD